MPTLTISSQNQTSLSDAERARLQALSGINKITATQTAPVATSPMAGTQAPATSSGFRIPASTAITSETLNPQVPTNFITPDPTLTYPTSALNSDIPELQATDQETKDSSLTQQLMDLNNSLTGEQAFRTEQETRQGLPDLFKTQTELASRVTALKNEALAIPLQLQQESIGRGITAGGLQPIQTAALRNNAIQALSASSLLEASRGNITLANDLVDRLVEQKFGPDKEKQKALTANLELVRNDPQTSLQDKNRADKQIALIKKRDDEIAKQEESAKTIFSLATVIAEQGADPKTLAKVQNATSIEEALNLAAPFLGKMERQKFELDSTLKRAQLSGIKIDNSIAREKLAQLKSNGTLGNQFTKLSSDQQDTAFKLIDDYEKASGTFFQVRDAYNRVATSAKNPSAAGDVALIFNYMKMLDPGSVVREGEFATAQNSGSIPDILRAKYNKVLNGQRLSDNIRADFSDRSKSLFDSANKQQESLNKEYTARSVRFGVPGDVVVRDITASIDGVATLDQLLKKLSPTETDALEKMATDDPLLTPQDLIDIFNKKIGN